MSCAKECTCLTCGKIYWQGDIIVSRNAFTKCSDCQCRPAQKPPAEKPFDFDEWIKTIKEMQQR